MTFAKVPYPDIATVDAGSFNYECVLWGECEISDRFARPQIIQVSRRIVSPRRKCVSGHSQSSFQAQCVHQRNVCGSPIRFRASRR